MSIMTSHPSTPAQGFFGKAPVYRWLFVAFLLALGLGIRLYDLTDLPLGTRQLRSAVMARGMYYQNLDSAPEWQRQAAVAMWKDEAIIEPPIMEWLTATSYRLVGGEYLWMARLISSLAWVASGLALYMLLRDLGFAEGGVIALAYHLFLPFAILESRTFQPDPLMVSLTVFALWAMVRWRIRRTWVWTILAGGLAGLAIFVKTVAAFPLVAAWAGLILAGFGLRKALRDPQVWVASALILLPGFLYYVYGTLISGFLVQQFSLRFFPELVRTPAFYVRWVEQIGYRVGYGSFLLSLCGILLLRNWEGRSMGIGLWIGYAAYGLSLPFHITTHDYYQLPLVPIVALGLGPVAEVVMRAIASFEKSALLRLGFIGILLFGMAFKMWEARVVMAQRDDRNEGIYWETLADKMGRDARVVGLTQDYGYRLAYFGWLRSQHWFTTGDFELRELAGGSSEDIFDDLSRQLADKDFFLMTLMGDFDRQPMLKELLYTHYPVFDEGPSYLIFDLRNSR